MEDEAFVRMNFSSFMKLWTLFLLFYLMTLFELLGNKIWKYLYRIYFCKIWNSNNRNIK